MRANSEAFQSGKTTLMFDKAKTIEFRRQPTVDHVLQHLRAETFHLLRTCEILRKLFKNFSGNLHLHPPGGSASRGDYAATQFRLQSLAVRRERNELGKPVRPISDRINHRRAILL
jgi:hypothetical protein